MTIVGDTFGGYTEVKLNDAYSWFEQRFYRNIKQIAYSREQIDRTVHIPLGMMEVYVALGMILFILIGGNDNEARLTLGILTVAFLRMLPSIRTLITLVTQWKNNAFTIDIIQNIPKTDQETTNHVSFCFHDKIEIKNVSFCYPNKEKFALKDFSMEINKGEVIGIQGASGIGKTTLLNLLLGFYTPQKGHIYIDNIELNEQNIESWQKQVAYVPQDIFLMDASLCENIAFGEENIDNVRIMQAIEQSGLKSLIDSLPDGIHTKVGQRGSRLSGGERQRVGIARALYKQASVILLDEATSALDLQIENEIMETIHRLSMENKDLTLIIVTHRQSSLSFCDRIIYIS